MRSDGGKRYAAGQWPTTDSRAFNREGAVASVADYPPNEKPPNYPCRHVDGGACPSGG